MALYDWFLSRDGIPEKTTFLKEQNQPTSKQNQEACIRIQINSCMLVFKRNLSHFFYIPMQTYYQWQNGREDLWGGSEFD